MPPQVVNGNAVATRHDAETVGATTKRLSRDPEEVVSRINVLVSLLDSVKDDIEAREVKAQDEAEERAQRRELRDRQRKQLPGGEKQQQNLSPARTPRGSDEA